METDHYCEDCETTFASDEDFHKHIKVPGQPSYYSCCVCRMTLRRRNCKGHNSTKDHQTNRLLILRDSLGLLQHPNPTNIQNNNNLQQNLVNPTQNIVTTMEEDVVDLSQEETATDTSALDSSTNYTSVLTDEFLEHDPSNYTSIQVDVVNDYERWAKGILDRQVDKLKDY